jgi:hypothetical protein
MVIKLEVHAVTENKLGGMLFSIGQVHNWTSNVGVKVA